MRNAESPLNREQAGKRAESRRQRAEDRRQKAELITDH
jgi:hypothetical protein